MVFTDNNPVAHLQSARLGPVEQRWVAQLASFDFKVKYRAGKENANADALSRFPINAVPQRKAASNTTGITALAVTVAGQDDTQGDLSEWEAAQMADPDIQVVRRYVEQGMIPSGHKRKTLSTGTAGLLRHHERLCIQGGTLCRKITDPNTQELRFQNVCPVSRRPEVWRRHHCACRSREDTDQPVTALFLDWHGEGGTGVSVWVHQL